MSEAPLYVRIAEGEALPGLRTHAPFGAVVVLNAQPSQEWETQATKWLIAEGCLYMMAWGEGCSRWHDSVDWASLEEFDFGEIPDDRFVMTTWHEDEPLEEVFWFAQFSAYHPDVELQSILILHVSDVDAREEMLTRFEAARDQD